VWLYRVAANKAKEYLRTEVRRRKREVAVTTTKAVSASRSEEIVRALQVAMEALDQKYRIPLALCYEQNFTKREAAAVLEMPEGTLSDHVRTGLTKLRKALERAGYPAAVAAVLGGLKQTAPTVPASLAGRVEALVAKGAAKTTAGAAASAGAAAKGGLAMKVVAGIVAAGALAAGVAVVVPGKGGSPEPLPAEAPASAVKEHPHNQKYKIEVLIGTGGFTYGTPNMAFGILNGPAREAWITDCQESAMDDKGNVYWMESGGFGMMRTVNVKTRRVKTLAGSGIQGHLDGPLSRARFTPTAGGAYAAARTRVSPDGRYLFVHECAKYYGGLLRQIDLEAGTVRTLGRYSAVRDATGEIYVLDLAGGAVPPGEGYRTLKLPPGKYSPNQYKYTALDAARDKLYYHSRMHVSCLDLKTGKSTSVNHGGRRPYPAAVKCDESGPLKERIFQCPGGLSISPGGRYLYLGGIDSLSSWRLDLKEEYVHVLKRNPDGTVSFGDGKECTKETSFGNSPFTFTFTRNGTGFFPCLRGMYMLTPVPAGGR